MTQSDSPTVIYLLGLPYSGTTLLAVLLGKSPDIFNAGELNFAENDYHPAKKCSCGELVDNCKAWSPVLETARSESERGEKTLSFTGTQKLRAVDAREGGYLKKVLKSLNFPPEWIFGREEIEDYAIRHGAFIRTIARETDVTFILDASKSHTRLRALDAYSDLSIKVVYVKRSAFESYAALIKRAKRRDKTYSALKAPLFMAGVLVRIWMLQNVISKCSDERTATINYDRLVNDPTASERDLSKSLGVEVDFQIRDKCFSTCDTHVWTGNIWLTRNETVNAKIELRHSDSIATLTTAEKAIYRIFSPVAKWLDRRLN